MTTARRDTVIADADCTYHCTSRCVRRAFLCGFDRLSGKNFDHRKAWVRNRLKFLVTVFSIEVAAFAAMSNHLHVLIRTLHGALERLSDEDVARRWLLLYPRRRVEDGSACEPDEVEIASLSKNPERIRQLRTRLGSVSWFMKSLDENIARRANREDECTGRFWEGRFKCQRLETEAAELNCAVYIDLNPLRAGLQGDESSPESTVTSAWERLEAQCARAELAACEDSGAELSGETLQELKSRGKMDLWLAPLGTSSREGTKPFLSLSLEQYRSILDWTSLQLRHCSGTKAPPPDIAAIFERLSINAEHFPDTSRNYGKLFYQVVGDPDSMKTAAAVAGKNWFKGISAARKVFSVSKAA